MLTVQEVTVSMEGTLELSKIDEWSLADAGEEV